MFNSMVSVGKYPFWVDNRQRKRRFENLSGKYFGRLRVLYRSTDELMSNGNTTPRYACVCNCGSESLVRATALRSGHISSCNQCNRRESLIGKNLEDLTGQKFNRWTVISRTKSIREPSGRLATVWLCRCDCGVLRNVRAGSLKGDLTFSCGCYKYEQLSVNRDLVGDVFGLWTVIEKDVDDWISPTNGRWYHSWLCKCSCGTVRSVVEQALVSNKSTSCGCTTESLLEVYTREYLSDLGVHYDTQVTYPDLRGVGDGMLSYDFAIIDERSNVVCFIECQGKQHYEPIDFFGGLPQFKVQVEHDRLKKLYADTLDIPLLEIDYHAKSYNDISKIISKFLELNI